MNEIWKSLILTSMKELQISEENMAKRLGMNVSSFKHLVLEEQRMTLTQLGILVSELHIDLNDVIALEFEDELDLVLQDDAQKLLNHIARSVPQKNRGHFLKAVKYLAQCFEE